VATKSEIAPPSSVTERVSLMFTPAAAAVISASATTSRSPSISAA
jgi:hypothetical protein